MRNTKQTLVALLAALVLANLSGQAEDTSLPNDRTYQEKAADRNSAYDRHDSNWRTRHASADSIHGKNVQASEIIGKKVVNDQGERLGKVDDLIVDDNFTVKYAVLSVGGAMGLGGNKIAVPVSDLNCANGSVRLSASKEELKNAASYPTGEWSAVSGQAWTRNVSGYYGQPIALQRFERDTPRNFNENREPVRTQQGAGAEKLMDLTDRGNLSDDSLIGTDSDRTEKSNDRRLRESVNDTIRKDYGIATALAVRVSVENGEVTLRGKVDNLSEKQNIEARIKETSGVSRVDNQLTVKN